MKITKQTLAFSFITIFTLMNTFLLIGVGVSYYQDSVYIKYLTYLFFTFVGFFLVYRAKGLFLKTTLSFSLIVFNILLMDLLNVSWSFLTK